MTEDEMTDDITISMDMSLSKLWEMMKDRAALHAVIHGLAKSQTPLKHLSIHAYTDGHQLILKH